MTDKIVTVTLRMSPEEHALLQKAAELDKRSINAFVLKTAIRQATTIIRKAILHYDRTK